MTEFTFPDVQWLALASKVIAVAATRVEGTWKAYIDCVPGLCHSDEWEAVLANGDPLHEPVARAIFPRFADIPYDE